MPAVSLDAADAGELDDFDATLRWPRWEELTSSLPADHGLSAIPPPFTAQGHADDVSRKPVPFQELLDFYDDAARQLTGVPDDGRIRITFTE
jgi:hypothetical protein